MSRYTPTQAVVGWQGVNCPIAGRLIASFPGPGTRVDPVIESPCRRNITGDLHIHSNYGCTKNITVFETSSEVHVYVIKFPDISSIPITWGGGGVYNGTPH